MDAADAGMRSEDDKETIKRLSERIKWLEALNELHALRFRRLEVLMDSDSPGQPTQKSEKSD
jgi:hypothetical protein